jgi:hypothetical protein
MYNLQVHHDTVASTYGLAGSRELCCDSAFLGCAQEITASKPDLPPIIERIFAEALEARGTDWDAIAALYAALHKGMPACSHPYVLPSPNCSA